MYETFFGLKRRPFLAVPDTESYFSTNQMEESSQSIERAVRRGEGIALLIGASGTGKTLLLRLLRKTLKTDYTVLLVSNGHLATPKSFFQQLLYDLRVPFSGCDETELRLQLLDFARKAQDAYASFGGGIVILIDESQFLSSSVFEEIRLLMNCDNGSMPFFRVVLAGTIELEEKLTHPQLESFNQRVVVRSYLESLSCEETRQYIAWQTNSSFGKGNEVPSPALGLIEFVENSGGGGSSEGRRVDSPHLKITESIFTENAKRQIFQLTEGLPRLVNQLCDIALQLAAERVLRQVDEVLIHSAWARLQQITNEESTESVSVVFPSPTIADIDKIVARKKATFQPKEFNSTVEFGTLDDSELVEESVHEPVSESANDQKSITTIRFRSPNEYKPPYPEDDEHSELELPKLKEPEEKSVEEFDAEIEPKPLEFYEDLETEIFFSSTISEPIRQLPLTEELNEAIEVVAEAVVEAGENTTKIVDIDKTTEPVAELIEEPIEEFVEEIAIIRRPEFFYPRHYRRTNENLAQKYRCRKFFPKFTPSNDDYFRSCIRKTSALLTLRRFDFTEDWIGNVSFRPLFVPSRLAVPFQPKQEIEPEMPKCYDIVETEIIIEEKIDEIINNSSREKDFEKFDMDLETLEKYAEAVLEGRPPFVRKEPNYAYQTTDSIVDIVPKTDGKVPYPDPVTGNVILLNWLTSEHEPGIGVGTPYREFLSRETPPKEIVHDVTERERLTAFAEFDLQRVVRVALDAFDDLSKQNNVAQNNKTSIDEPFEEIIAVEMMSVSSDHSSYSSPAPLSFLHENTLLQQIVTAVNRITEAAGKIEQAAQRSEDAGQQIKQAAGFVEREVNAALPTYKELFRELSEFHQTISAELNDALPKHCEHPAKLLPFSIRTNFGTITPTPLALENSDEKSIDFQKLFQ